MRTVDPDTWYKKTKKPVLNLARPYRFGQKVEMGIERSIRLGLKQALREYIEHCSIEIVNYAVAKDLHGIKRIVRYIITFLIIIGGQWIFFLKNLELLDQPPLVVNIESTQHSFVDVPFPAIAICSNNLISKKALKEYASFLYSMDHNKTYSLQKLEANLLSFGALVTFDNPVVDSMFVQFLQNLMQHNVTNIMSKVSPLCRSLLKKCSWRGVEIPCERLFAPRLTQNSFCCTFNARYQTVDLDNKARHLNLLGIDLGLTAVITDDTEDYAYPRRPGVGLEILMFEGSEFPANEGGVVRSFPTSQNTSLFFSLSVREQYAAKSVFAFSEEWCGCRQRRHEGERWLRSYAWCLWECRRRTVRALCACVPFYMLPESTDTLCTVSNLFCLHKYREKLLYYYPHNMTDPGLSEELQDSVYCEECLPDCSRVTYSAKVSANYFLWSRKLRPNLFGGTVNFTNTTVLRFFFTSEDQLLFLIEPNLRWYEISASFSSLWVLLTGVSLVSIAEFVYHFTYRLYYHSAKRIRMGKSGFATTLPLESGMKQYSVFRRLSGSFIAFRGGVCSLHRRFHHDL